MGLFITILLYYRELHLKTFGSLEEHKSVQTPNFEREGPVGTTADIMAPLELRGKECLGNTRMLPTQDPCLWTLVSTTWETFSLSLLPESRAPKFHWQNVGHIQKPGVGRAWER